MIQKSDIHKVVEATDLARLVSEHIQLKPQSGRHVGCCPFHNEKTGSFVVYPDGHYHCFGCGKHGDAITFVMDKMGMDFLEAVRWLARRANIELHEREETEKERAERMETEQLYVTNELAYRNFREAFHQSDEAKAYAYKRWGKDYCDEIGMGFAPGGQFLVGKHHHRKSLLTLGLINDKDEDFFRNRVVIPIRDRMQRVIAFTARRIDGMDDYKYINSKESPIFKKGKVLFGADVAFHNIQRNKPVIWVEGGPDVMRCQILGIKNVVSCLGTAISDEQFEQMMKLSPSITIVPDSDPPKPGEKFGTGLKAAIKNGRAALEKGFRVYVKQIPVGKEKRDPDSYFTSRQKFDALEEEDFILWYSRYRFEDAVSPLEKSEAVKDVSSLLSYVKDGTSLDMYLDELKQYGPGKRVWLKAIEGEKQRMEIDRSKASATDSTDEMEQKYGFHEENNKYYSVTDKGSVYEWSNFKVFPLYLIKYEDKPLRMFLIRNEFGDEALISLEPGDLVSLNAFRTKVEQEGNFIWKATEKELIKLKGFLYKNTETAYPILQLGWQKEDFFAFGNGVCVNGKFIPTDDQGIVKLPGRGIFFLASNASYNRQNHKQFAFEHQFVYRDVSKITLAEFTDQFFKVFGDNARVGFAFLLATLFKDLVIRKTRSFPLLNLFGPKGSGKSDMAANLMKFFLNESKGLSLLNSSMPALGMAVGAVANALVHLEEYKNELPPNRIEFQKGMWDGIGRTKMSMDVSNRSETSAVDSGVIVSGQEMPTADIALFTRLIFLQFPRSEFTLEEKADHRKLMDMMQPGLTHLTVQILGLRDYMEKRFPAMYDQTFDLVSRRLKNDPIEDRILKNWVTVLAVYRTLEMELGINLSSQDLLNICVDGIKNQSRETKSNSELGSFWNVIQFLVSEGELVDECDYKIKSVRKFSSSKIKNAEWQENRTVLYLQKSRVFMLYKMRERSAGDNIIPDESLKYYLEQSRAFLGEKNVCYYVSKNGEKVVAPDYMGQGPPKYQRTTQRSYCFDYNILKSVYGINLFSRQDDGNDYDEDE